jgi:hydrogenase maturation protein HypF
MAENGFEGEVIGVSFDGTGYGDDGTIWGGELMVCSYRAYRRVGSIKPFIQTGGDLSSKEGWRIASALLRDAFGDGGEILCRKLGICETNEYKLQKAMAEKGLNSVRSTSCGQLFDAVSAILGIVRTSTFEGEASTALMAEAERFAKTGGVSKALPADISHTESGIVLDTGALASDIAKRYLSGEDRGALAYEFHTALSQMITLACEEIRTQRGLETVALSGGVFQNRLLVSMTKERLEAKGFKVLLHSLVPPNDGGIALGQAVYAKYYKKNGE